MRNDDEKERKERKGKARKSAFILLHFFMTNIIALYKKMLSLTPSIPLPLEFLYHLALCCFSAVCDPKIVCDNEEAGMCKKAEVMLLKGSGGFKVETCWNLRKKKS